jgi:hypothetical protein
MINSVRRALVALLAALAIQHAAVAQPDTSAAPPGWPRVFSDNNVTVEVAQPQVDEWKDYNLIRFRAAFTVTPRGTAQPQYGVVALQARTVVDNDARTVLLSGVEMALRFPNLPEAQAAALRERTAACLPDMNGTTVSLDQVLAYTGRQVKPATVNVSLDPPPLYFSDSPAVLVVFIGPPQMKPVAGTQLMFAVNTNWMTFLDAGSGQYYLLNGSSWLTAPDLLKGPWTAAGKLPAEFAKLPADAAWEEARKNIPGQPAASVPRVFATTQPAELIVTDGSPVYTPVTGTRLMYVSNPVTPLFLDLAERQYYYLASGRWFRAEGISGPWSAASTALPADFAKIPSDGPLGFVLASVPNTQEARDAVTLASVPHKAVVDVKNASLDVAYDGAPRFEPVQGTALTYGANTSYQIVCCEGKYYCCYQGVWFTAPAPTGPWSVCTSVPQAIYTIPPSSPLYNVTYVQVYDATNPDSVVVGYTNGYYGEYVGPTGTLVYGAGVIGWWRPAYYWPLYAPCYYSYGFAARYNYLHGGYYRAGGYYYGPYGGAGWGAFYNPATGAWARRGYAYGPGGAVWGGQAYNPFTNTYRAHTGGVTGYESWGKTVVSQGSRWAEAGHVTTAAGTTAAVKTSSGNVYAGRDGNVYRNTDGQWQKYEGNGNWQDASWNRSTARTSAAVAAENRAPVAVHDWNNPQWKSNWESPRPQPAPVATQRTWTQHDAQTELNHDAWARNYGGRTAAVQAGRTGGGRRR